MKVDIIRFKTSKELNQEYGLYTHAPCMVGDMSILLGQKIDIVSEIIYYDGFNIICYYDRVKQCFVSNRPNNCFWYITKELVVFHKAHLYKPKKFERRL